MSPAKESAVAEPRKPYARTLAVLRVLTWPYRYPPLSWLVKLNNWITASNTRFVTVVATSTLVCVAIVVVEVARG
jgi:hypothetical protein